MPSNAEPELMGATTSAVELTGAGAFSHVELDLATRGSVSATLAAARTDGNARETDAERFFLNLENVRGASDATAFRVYVGLGPGEDPAGHPELLAGSIAPFGVRKASQPEGERAGDGLTFVLDITDIVNDLHLAGSLDVARLPVRLVPVHPVRHGTELTIGRISIYHHSA